MYAIILGRNCFRRNNFRILRWEDSQIRSVWNDCSVNNKVTPPWLMLSDPDRPDYRYFFNIASDGKTLALSREIHLPEIAGNPCIGSSEGFLFTIPMCKSPKIIHAINPLTKERLYVPNPASLQSLRYDDYSKLHLRSIYNVELWEKDIVLDRYFFELYYSKAVLSPSRDIIFLLRNGSTDYAYLPSDYSGKASTSSWNNIESHVTSCCMSEMEYYDCIFHGGHFHLINFDGQLSVLDHENPPLNKNMRVLATNAPRSIDYMDARYRRALVESPNQKDLFYIKRFAHPTNQGSTFHFEVFKLNKHGGDGNYEWNQIESIGDLAFFVGPNTSVAFSANDFPNLRPNSIYFTDYFPSDCELLGSFHNVDTGFFNLEDGSINIFDITVDNRKFNWPRPIWFMPVSPSSKC